MSPVGVGVIGVGVISDTYLENLNSFPDVEVLVVGDLIADRARAQAEKHGVPAHGSGDDVLAHPGVQMVFIPLTNLRRNPTKRKLTTTHPFQGPLAWPNCNGR